MVLAVRLDKAEQSQLNFISKKRHLNKTQAVKELFHRGFLMYQLDDYRSGNLSIGKLAEALNVSVVEALNYVASYNAHPKVPKDFLVEAAETAKKLFDNV